MSQNFKFILVETQNRVATITLNRPEVHNAFNDSMIAELKELFSVLHDDPETRIVLIRGAGDSFSAGGDLKWIKEMATYNEEEYETTGTRFHQMLEMVYRFPKPVVARVHGTAVGGGAGLVAAVDLAYAEEGTQFGFSEVRLGLVPAIVAPFVLRKVKEGHAKECFLTGERFSAQEATRIGLVQGWAKAEELDELISKKIRAMLLGAPEALLEAKTIIEKVRGIPLEEVGVQTAKKIAERWMSEEGKEGMSAFLNRRKPSWVE